MAVWQPRWLCGISGIGKQHSSHKVSFERGLLFQTGNRTSNTFTEKKCLLQDRYLVYVQFTWETLRTYI